MTKEKIRRILRERGRLLIDPDTLGDSSDLSDAGMTSHASVMVLLALENAFDLEFPDSMLSRSVFTSIDSISDAIESLRKERTA